MKGTPDLPMDAIGPCDEGTHRRDAYDCLSGRKGFSSCCVHEHAAFMGIGRTLMSRRRT